MFIYCLQCKKQTTNPKFCSRSCSVSYNNKGRVRDDASRKKTSDSLKSLSVPYTKINQCVECKKYFPIKSRNNRETKTCSSLCCKRLLSKKASENLSKRDRRNTGRGRKSYMEQSFENWLLMHNFTEFQTEVKFKNHDTNKTYFADFVFPSLSLIIELDGTQHRNTKLQDSIRDAYISEHYGYFILRISHADYQKKNKIDLVKKLLNIA